MVSIHDYQQLITKTPTPSVPGGWGGGGVGCTQAIMVLSDCCCPCLFVVICNAFFLP